MAVSKVEGAKKEQKNRAWLADIDQNTPVLG
jgi:hypothetical protein